MPGSETEISPVLTVEELATQWRVHPSTVRAAIAKGDIPTVRCGRRILIPRAKIDAMLGLPARAVQS